MQQWVALATKSYSWPTRSSGEALANESYSWPHSQQWRSASYNRMFPAQETAQASQVVLALDSECSGLTVASKLLTVCLLLFETGKQALGWLHQRFEAHSHTCRPSTGTSCLLQTACNTVSWPHLCRRPSRRCGSGWGRKLYWGMAAPWAHPIVPRVARSSCGCPCRGPAACTRAST